jgi:hypothetical protein
MADYRNDDDRTLPGAGMNRTPETDPEHLIPDHTSAGALGAIPAAATSDDPDAVRGEIERTRARMSRTIDQLDRALVRKKEEVQEKLDVAAPIRRSPWTYAGGVFGAGLVLGLLTGGGKSRDDDDDENVKIPRALLAGLGLEPVKGGRSRGGGPDDWETRSRELMSVVARQEEEIRNLRGGPVDDAGWDAEYLDDEPEGYLAPNDARLLDDVEALGEAGAQDEWDEDWNFDEDDYAEAYGESFTGEHDGELAAYADRGIDFRKPLAALFAAGVAGALGTVARRMLGGRGGSGEMDVEVELEHRGGAASDVYVDEAGRTARRDARHPAGYGRETHRPQGMYGPEYGAEGGYGGGRAHEPGYGAEEYEAVPARPGYTRPDAGYGGVGGGYAGEMEVEVELERPVQPFRPAQPVRHSLPPEHRGPRVSPLAGAVAAGAAAAVSGLVARLLHNRAERAAEMEVELESRRPAAPRRSPAPVRPAAPYVPQSASRPRAAGGELEVEVELEQNRTAAPGAWTPSAHPERTAGAAGTSEAPSTTGTTGPTGSSGLSGGTGTAGTAGGPGTGGTSGPASPPLM